MNEQKKRRPSQKPARSAAPEVVYTQPAPVDRKRLIYRLVTVAVVVLAIFIGFSIFFRVDTIVVCGNEQYSAEMVREASGIEEGDSLLGFGKTKACGRIAESMPYVLSVRISIKLPGTVTIYIEEVKVTYSVQDQSGEWWLLASDGRVMEKVGPVEAAKHTDLLGITLDSPQIGKRAKALEPESMVTGEEDKPITVTAEDRLSAALNIIDRMEYRNILGEAANVDVSDMNNIVLWYGTQYKVLLGNGESLDYKVDTMKGAIEGLASHQSGVLEILYGIPPQKDGLEQVITDEVWYAAYRPFE